MKVQTAEKPNVEKREEQKEKIYETMGIPVGRLLQCSNLPITATREQTSNGEER